MPSMLATAGLLLLGPWLLAAPTGSPPGLSDEALKSALLRDGEANYRPVVHYDIEVRLDPATKMLDAKARVTWKNDGRWPVSELWWHLYLNGFRNEKSTFLREAQGSIRRSSVGKDNWGWTEVTSITARDLSATATVGEVRYDLMPTASFEAPDDGNRDDRTVWKTPLPFAVAPGEQVEVMLAWQAKLPKVFARTGHAGSFFMVGQWFPKLGVLEESFRGAMQDFSGEPRWNCHQFHATTEFFADYGTYRVQMTVPRNYVVGATGRRIQESLTADGWVTHEYYQDRVHDFAWTADSRFVVHEFTFNPSSIPAQEIGEVAVQLGLQPDQLQLQPVAVTMLLQPEHESFAARYRAAIEHGLKWMGLWFGAYPYQTLTLVDGPRNGGGAMGMEYPTLFTGGVGWPSPPETLSPEEVTMHEFGHQYWYGLVGSNEFEEAWLDEGLTNFSHGLVLDKVYGPAIFRTKLLGASLAPWFINTTLSQREKGQIGNMVAPDIDAIAQPAWLYRDRLSYGLNSYPRAQLAFMQLGHVIGPDKVLQGLRVYHQRWRYRHPTTYDLQVAFEEVSGRSLQAFFDTVIYGNSALDYAIVSLSSKKKRSLAGVYQPVGVESSTISFAVTASLAAAPPRPVRHRVVTSSDAEALDDAAENPVYITEVLVERRGEQVVNPMIEVTFEDDLPYRSTFHGPGRWHRIKVESASKAVSARLYVDQARPMDARPSNDTRLREADPVVGLSWGARILYWSQSIFQLLGGLL